MSSQMDVEMNVEMQQLSLWEDSDFNPSIAARADSGVCSLSGFKNRLKPVERYLTERRAALAIASGIQSCLRPFQFIITRINQLKSRSRFHGWRMGILLGSYMSATILCFNIGFVIFAATSRSGFQDGFAEPFHNSRNMSRLSSGAHILINILSTLLLGASNYTMQVLSSPTRAEVDKAHLMGKYLDVGILSIHNLRHISRKRGLLCAILVFSSIPIHLFYNSAAIYVATTNEFGVFFVQPGSLQDEDMRSNTDFTYFPGQTWRPAYNTSLVKYHDLYLAVDQWASQINKWDQSGSPWESVATPFTLPIQETNVTLSSMLSNVTEWVNITTPTAPIPSYARVSHAYGVNSRATDRLQFSLRFLLVVILCNVIKLAVMLWILCIEKSDFLVTIGDAVASFLERSDPVTEKCSVFCKEAITARLSHRTSGQIEHKSIELSSNSEPDQQSALDQTMPHKKGISLSEAYHDTCEVSIHNSRGVWYDLRYPYLSALGKDRRAGPLFIYSVTFSIYVLCGILIAGGLISHMWGTSSDTILGGVTYNPADTLLVAWIANSPQIILSFCYFTLNNACTAMAGAYEWNNMASSRKGLRVTKPLEEQRSTYFLQLPLRFSLPLAAISGSLHWLLSQSVFLIRIDSINLQNQIDRENSKSACGFSGLSFLVLSACFYTFLIAICMLGRKHTHMRIPFAQSCSLVISAACHVPLIEHNPHLRKVQWGVVEEAMFDGEMHCSISSRPVQKPIQGTVYL